MITNEAVAEMKMKVRAELPADIKSLRVSNPHYVDLEDVDGNVAHLVPQGVVKYICDDCKAVFLMTSNHGAITCPLCGQKGKAKPVWGSLQVSFVPEKESDFSSSLVVNKK